MTGHVLIGGDLNNYSSETTIEDGLLVGLNKAEDNLEGNASIGAGGLTVNINGYPVAVG